MEWTFRTRIRIPASGLLFFGNSRNFPLQTRLGWNFNYAQEWRYRTVPPRRPFWSGPPGALVLPVHFLRCGRNYDMAA